MFEHAAADSQGRRDYQEDNHGFLELDAEPGSSRPLLCIVADGMGGHAGGAAASGAVVESLKKYFTNPPRDDADPLLTGIDEATRAVAGCENDNPELSGLGCTLIAAIVTEVGVEWVSVGDSPFWVLRAGKLVRLNADHSMKPVLERMVEDGQISQADAAADPQRHHLRSAVTKDAPELVDRSPSIVPLGPGDVLLLASDGVLTLSEDEIAAIIAGSPDLRGAAQRLIEAVDAKGAKTQDNTTVMLVRRSDAATHTTTSPPSVAAGAATAPTAAAPDALPVEAMRSRTVPAHAAPKIFSTSPPTAAASNKTGMFAGIALAAVLVPSLAWTLWPQSSNPTVSPVASAPQASSPAASPDAVTAGTAESRKFQEERALGLAPTALRPPSLAAASEASPPNEPAEAAVVAGEDPSPSGRLGKKLELTDVGVSDPPVLPSTASTAATAAPAARQPSAAASSPSPATVAPPAVAVVATSPAEESTGTLVVRSMPSGATVFVNGKPAGVADGKARQLAPGVHTVEVRQVDFVSPPKQKVTLEAGKSEQVSITLCKSHERQACRGNEVWWFDGCAVPEALARSCSADEKCIDAECRPACKPRTIDRCIDGQKFWFDSCGAREASPFGTCPKSPPPPPAPPTPHEVKPTPAKDCGNPKAKRGCKPGDKDVWWFNACGEPTDVIAEPCRGADTCRTRGTQSRCD